jgi:hypothetical protein
MALLTISGDPRARWEEVAHTVAQLLGFELVTEPRLAQWMTAEFGDAAIPPRAWRAAATAVLTRLATEHHLVIAVAGSEHFFEPMPLLLRAYILAPATQRAGNLMLDDRLEKPEALARIRALDAESRRLLRTRFGRVPADALDITIHAAHTDPLQAAEILAAAVSARKLEAQGLLSSVSAAELQFETRLQLARHGIAPAGRAEVKRTAFGHPSEEMFANLLDFYRIQWEYEPRSFPLQWDKDGRVTEAFTPDFYLPEFDLYLELTTMKQALVTRKNRKVKLLRAIYPHVNIQVFYQKDFQDLVFKHGLKTAS